MRIRRFIGLAVLVAFSHVLPGGLAGAQVWTLEAEPALELGGGMSDPDDQFGFVVTARRLPGGRIAVLDALPVALRLYNSDGSHHRDFGSAGDGPGEYRQPADLLLRGDKAVVLDRAGRRTWIALDGSVVRTDRLVIEATCGEDFNARYGGLLPDGSLLVRCEERLFGRVRGEYRQKIGLRRMRLTGQTDAIGVFPADSGRADRGDTPIPRPYLPRSGLLWSSAADRLFVASGTSPSVQVFSLSGKLLASLTIAARSRPATGQDVEEVTAEATRLVGSANDRRVIEEWYSEMPRAERTPAIRSLVAVSADELWIETWERDGDRSWWLVVDGTGSLLARVLAPARGRLLEAGSDWTLWLWRDEFDVEHVRLHRLERTPA